MVKLVAKICVFFLVFGLIMTWMKSCEGSIFDKFLDDIFSSSEDVKNNDDITYEDIENADPDQFCRYVNIKLSKIDQQYVSCNATNIAITNGFTSIDAQITNYNQSISNQTAYINYTNIDQQTLINWTTENRNYISQLEKQYKGLDEKNIDYMLSELSKLKIAVSKLTVAVSKLRDAVSKNKNHFDKYIEKYNKEVIKNETIKYNAIQKEFIERIEKLSSQIKSLSDEIKDNNNRLRDLNKSIKKCIRTLTALNEKLCKLIEKSGNVQAAEDINYYYIIDTENELITKGIVSSGGLFGGLKVVPQPDKKHFGILTDKNKTIMLGEEDMEFDVLSEMPADSYEYRVVNRVKVLIIKDVDRFWSQTAFLIIKRSE